MDNTAKPIGVDASGFEMLTNAVRELLNQYPALNGRSILFEDLDENFGIAFSADGGALVMSERRSITNHVAQVCQYPFLVVYRSENQGETEKAAEKYNRILELFPDTDVAKRATEKMAQQKTE